MFGIKDDYELIVHKLPEELEYANIYPLGDLHIGSDMFNEDIWKRWKKLVMDDPNGYIVFIGDLLDNGLRNSKTSPYNATMSPFEQKLWLKKELKPFAELNKILGGTKGNHEHRTSDLVDGCPLYDVMTKLDLEDYYRENMAFMKINLGYKNSERQWSYTVVLAHGASKTKTSKFQYAVDGMDVLVTGHIHDSGVSFPAKIVVDTKNETVKQVGFAHLIVPSFQSYGGYAMRAMYAPTANDKFPVITLNGRAKEVTYHWI